MVSYARILFVALGVLGTLGLHACVQPDEFRALQGEVRRNAVEYSQQIAELNEQVAELQQQLEAEDARGTQLADHLNDFTLLQQEVASLRGQIEELTHKRQTQIQQELESLKKMVEAKEGLQPGSKPGLQPDLQPPTTKPTTAPSPPSATAPEPVERAEDLYKEGRFAFEQGDYSKAREIFTALLSRHPDSTLVDNGQFWIGETFFREGNFKQAVLEYEKMISQYPGSPKVPAAYLKQGMAFEKLGDTESARYLYGKITREYSNSDQAPMAAHRLKSLP